ncbi:low temperature requirement protein A [Georgenia ruanii]|uniref:Low temperature requirement protein A n=1 Tax=Georgenia ruanii TaxID=348442 RepID=A0A7J9V0Y0_9MICO|nr:low temperature requirement protein A [Georgenia ruanii]MPV90545.1 low temperature requirement protein A [Georgenia ruanii]
MSGRDPDEDHRNATPLELLYDLTFVVAFGQDADQFAHLLGQGHLAGGLIGFGFATFAICWAWTNFSWFASAYDTDDWAFRLATMVQMVGVLILALSLPQVFQSLDTGGPVSNAVAVAGYVVMRVAMVFLWLRAAKHDPSRRRACLDYAVTIGIAQVGWVALIPAHLTLGAFFAWGSLFLLIEVGGPLLAERRKGGTPWHAQHIAERYALLTIIALGEGVIGTVASLGAVVGAQGWTFDAALVALAGTGLTFGMWWMYFLVPTGELLQAHRERGLPWGYAHILLFASVVATGAGLQVAAYYLAGQAHIGAASTVLAVALPVAAFVITLFASYTYLVHAWDSFALTLLAGTAAVLTAAFAMAALSVPMAICLVMLMLAPVVTVVGYETIGHRHMALTLERALAG